MTRRAHVTPPPVRSGTRCSSFGALAHCVEPAVAVVESVCAHGHIREGSVCVAHLSLLSDALCATCHAYDIPHNCILTIREIRRTGASY